MPAPSVRMLINLSSPKWVQGFEGMPGRIH